MLALFTIKATTYLVPTMLINDKRVTVSHLPYIPASLSVFRDLWTVECNPGALTHLMKKAGRFIELHVVHRSCNLALRKYWAFVVS
jgi:hypothetical protein